MCGSALARNPDQSIKLSHMYRARTAGRAGRCNMREASARRALFPFAGEAAMRPQHDFHTPIKDQILDG
jgi:hypothetical protein